MLGSTTVVPEGVGRASPFRRTQRPPLLEADQERALVLAAKGHRAEARGQLIDTFRPYVASYASRYRNAPGVERPELMQQGVVGLLSALERFDTERGTPFWAYAAWSVREAMQQLVSELTRPVVLSDRAERQLARVNGARRTHLHERGHDATPAEIAASTGLGLQQVGNLVAAGRPSRSLEEPVRAHGVEVRLGDQIADPSAEEAFDAPQWPIDASMLGALLKVLSARERQVVMARFGLAGPERTLRDLGAELGVSAERVRQIEKGALERLYQTAVGGTSWRQEPALTLADPGLPPVVRAPRPDAPCAVSNQRRSPTMSTLEAFPPWLRDMNRIFGGENAVAAFIPPADLLVSDDGVSVYMDVPGVGRDRLEIDLENDVLTIRGERPYPYPTDDPQRVVRRVERGFGRFERSLRVPRGLDADTIDASLHDGVLSLRIPRPVTQQPHRIEIKDGADVAEASGSPELAAAGATT